MKAEGKSLLWLLLIPPAAAVFMGVLMLILAVDTNPGVINPSAPPLSKTSWRDAAAAASASEQPVESSHTFERERPTP